ncbi:response regulator transcription factor [Pseudoxanthomonas sp. Root630]|uniref:response regulator transcription factor n=1 Tax=Pseudoxanthomonas sp. Root630 TaxID=1736574 RepID=UPI0009D65DC9|nr:response regulator transcription factor [Pseudoxanthomonas sp. Root630]
MEDASAEETARRLRVLVADDHKVVGEGVVRLLQDRFRDVRMVMCGRALLDVVRGGDVDVVVTDVAMGDMTGIDAMRELRSEGILTPFIFLTMHDGFAVVAEALRSGANGYVLKAAAGDELLHAVAEVAAGRAYLAPSLAAMAIASTDRPDHLTLTDKQQRILDWVAQGLRSKQIAYELGVSVRTVESHKYTMMQQMGVHGTLELVRRAHQLGLIRAFRDADRPAA